MSHMGGHRLDFLELKIFASSQVAMVLAEVRSAAQVWHAESGGTRMHMSECLSTPLVTHTLVFMPRGCNLRSSWSHPCTLTRLTFTCAHV